MSAHTPGPWDVREQDDEFRVHAPDSRSYGFRVEMRIVDEVGGYSEQLEDGTWDNAQAKANARLIAAAPELLDALQMVRDYVVRMKGWGHGYQLAVDAAIAKASGEQL